MPHLRLLVIGGPRVGKSALCRQFLDEAWVERRARDVADSLPIEHKHVKIVTVEGQPCRVEVLDAFASRLFDEGQMNELFDEFESVCHGVVLVYDITRRESLDELDLFRKQIAEMSSQPAAFLVGCKADLEDSRQIPAAVGATTADEWGMTWFEVSARAEFAGVQQIFASMIVKIHERYRAETRESGCTIA